MTVPLRVLIVEDSEADAILLSRELRDSGYEISFERVASSTSMSAALQKQHWDLVISDYTIPGFSGVDALKLLRAKSSEIPFIFVSGTIGEERAVAALKLGAQDYVMKDNLGRLVPTIRRELQEAGQRRERARLEQENRRLHSRRSAASQAAWPTISTTLSASSWAGRRWDATKCPRAANPEKVPNDSRPSAAFGRIDVPIACLRPPPSHPAAKCGPELSRVRNNQSAR